MSTNGSTTRFPAACKCYFSAWQARERNLILHFAFHLRLLSLWISNRNYEMHKKRHCPIILLSVRLINSYTKTLNHLMTIHSLQHRNRQNGTCKPPPPPKFPGSNPTTDYLKLSRFLIRIPALPDWNKGSPGRSSDCSIITGKTLL
jgi:hypothetical protein